MPPFPSFLGNLYTLLLTPQPLPKEITKALSPKPTQQPRSSERFSALNLRNSHVTFPTFITRSPHQTPPFPGSAPYLLKVGLPKEELPDFLPFPHQLQDLTCPRLWALSQATGDFEV